MSAEKSFRQQFVQMNLHGIGLLLVAVDWRTSGLAVVGYFLLSDWWRNR